jgi:hypothetical protein
MSEAPFAALDLFPRRWRGRRGSVDIYALVDPRDMTVRYIGRTGVGELRLYRHLYTAPSDGNVRKADWLLDLTRTGKEPLMVALTTCSPERATQHERKWIARVLEHGDLYNIHLRSDRPKRLRRANGTRTVRWWLSAAVIKGVKHEAIDADKKLAEVVAELLVEALDAREAARAS